MAIVLEGSAGATDSGTTCAVSYTATAGRLVVALCATKAGSTLTSVVDNNAVSMTAAFNSTRYGLFYQENVASGVTGYTLTGGSNLAMIILEFSGVATSSALDQVSTIATGSGTTPTSSAVTTGTADEVLVGYFYQTTNTTDFGAGTNWNVGRNQDLTAQSENLGALYRVVSATGSYQALATSGSVNWAANIATFKAAGGGGAVAGIIGNSIMASSLIGNSAIAGAE